MARKSPVSGRAGSVRIQRLSSVALSAAEAHGKRLDYNGKARAVYDQAPITSTGLDLNDLYDRHIQGDNTDGVGRAKVHKSTTKALHMLLQFPTNLIDGEDGDELLKHARNFAVSVFGDEAIFADRVDRDEKSRHVVDLILAPKYLKETKRGTSYAVSTSVHLKRLAAERGKAPTLRGQGQALQDAWFDYLRDKVGLNVERGAAKSVPGDDWLSPEELEAERISDRFEAVLSERLFPENEMDLRPPTPEEEVILKRAQKALDAAAKKAVEETRRKAESDRQSALKAETEYKEKLAALEQQQENIKKQQEELERLITEQKDFRKNLVDTINKKEIQNKRAMMGLLAGGDFHEQRGNSSAFIYKFMEKNTELFNSSKFQQYFDLEFALKQSGSLNNVDKPKSLKAFLSKNQKDTDYQRFIKSRLKKWTELLEWSEGLKTRPYTPEQVGHILDRYSFCLSNRGLDAAIYEITTDIFIDGTGNGMLSDRYAGTTDGLYLWGSIGQCVLQEVYELVEKLMGKVAQNIKEYAATLPKIDGLKRALGLSVNQEYPKTDNNGFSV